MLGASVPEIGFGPWERVSPMARPPQQPPRDKGWTPDSIRVAIRKLRRRIADLEAFKPEEIKERRDPAIDALQAAIGNTLNDVFSQNTPAYQRYSDAATIDTARLNMNGVPHLEVVEGLVHGKNRAIELLDGAIRMLAEKMEDDFPDEPVEQVALSARTAITSTGSAAGGLQGAETLGTAGDVRVSVQSGMTADGVVIVSSEARYADLQARVTLLEGSLHELRSELATPRQQEVGIGHNRGPAFAPVRVEELDEVDTLIALLKDRGPTPPTDPAPIIEQNEKVTRIGQRISDGLVELGKEIAKGAAREVGKEALAPYWTAIAHWIASVGHTLLVWLGLS
jgi:hypothetical protein